MDNPHIFFRIVVCTAFVSLFISCQGKKGKVTDTIADTPQELQRKSISIIQDKLDHALSNNGKLDDSGSVVVQARIARLLYEKNDFEPIWCKKEQWLATGDSLFSFMQRSKLFGLFPEDYHAKVIEQIRDRFIADSLGKGDRKDAALWSKADIMLTDGFIQALRDIKLGRLPQDSITMRKDSVLLDEFYQAQLDAVNKGESVTAVFEKLEPVHDGYHKLKKGIEKFLAGFDDRQFTFVPSMKDSLKFVKALQRRLFEGGYISFTDRLPDSLQLAGAIKKFQKEKGIAADGKAGEGTVRVLNSSDREKFIRIAINMDKYKMLPEQLPERYVWVNAASNYLHVIDEGEVKLSSKVICGRPKTRTPVLTSLINGLITYPQWVPPPSIVMKEILPAVKRNPGYLARRGFSLVNSKGETINPYSVNWSKYTKGIPYRIVQGSGDANALGVMKFVFDNKYSVYLHDTNQRYLFANGMRSLSHGCVRVQEWEKLATYILVNDSLRSSDGKYTSIDSMKLWLDTKKKKNINLKNKIPVYIRYITCEGQQDGAIVFYEDIYSEDKMLREKYFASK
jgi:L,D-transpeptidase YcbB